MDLDYSRMMALGEDKEEEEVESIQQWVQTCEPEFRVRSGTDNGGAKKKFADSSYVYSPVYEAELNKAMAQAHDVLEKLQQFKIFPVLKATLALDLVRKVAAFGKECQAWDSRFKLVENAQEALEKHIGEVKSERAALRSFWANMDEPERRLVADSNRHLVELQPHHANLLTSDPTTECPPVEEGDPDPKLSEAERDKHSTEGSEHEGGGVEGGVEEPVEEQKGKGGEKAGARLKEKEHGATTALVVRAKGQNGEGAGGRSNRQKKKEERKEKQRQSVIAAAEERRPQMSIHMFLSDWMEGHFCTVLQEALEVTQAQANVGPYLTNRFKHYRIVFDQVLEEHVWNEECKQCVRQKNVMMGLLKSVSAKASPKRHAFEQIVRKLKNVPWPETSSRADLQIDDFLFDEDFQAQLRSRYDGREGITSIWSETGTDYVDLLRARIHGITSIRHKIIYFAEAWSAVASGLAEPRHSDAARYMKKPDTKRILAVAKKDSALENFEKLIEAEIKGFEPPAEWQQTHHVPFRGRGGIRLGTDSDDEVEVGGASEIDLDIDDLEDDGSALCRRIRSQRARCGVEQSVMQSALGNIHARSVTGSRWHQTLRSAERAGNLSEGCQPLSASSAARRSSLLVEQYEREERERGRRREELGAVHISGGRGGTMRVERMAGGVGGMPVCASEGSEGEERFAAELDADLARAAFGDMGAEVSRHRKALASHLHHHRLPHTGHLRSSYRAARGVGTDSESEEEDLGEGVHGELEELEDRSRIAAARESLRAQGFTSRDVEAKILAAAEAETKGGSLRFNRVHGATGRISRLQQTDRDVEREGRLLHLQREDREELPSKVTRALIRSQVGETGRSFLHRTISPRTGADALAGIEVHGDSGDSDDEEGVGESENEDYAGVGEGEEEEEDDEDGEDLPEVHEHPVLNTFLKRTNPARELGENPKKLTPTSHRMQSFSPTTAGEVQRHVLSSGRPPIFRSQASRASEVLRSGKAAALLSAGKSSLLSRKFEDLDPKIFSDHYQASSAARLISSSSALTHAQMVRETEEAIEKLAGLNLKEAGQKQLLQSLDSRKTERLRAILAKSQQQQQQTAKHVSVSTQPGAAPSSGNVLTSSKAKEKQKHQVREDIIRKFIDGEEPNEEELDAAESVASSEEHNEAEEKSANEDESPSSPKIRLHTQRADQSAQTNNTADADTDSHFHSLCGSKHTNTNRGLRAGGSASVSPGLTSGHPDLDDAENEQEAAEDDEKWHDAVEPNASSDRLSDDPPLDVDAMVRMQCADDSSSSYSDGDNLDSLTGASGSFFNPPPRVAKARSQTDKNRKSSNRNNMEEEKEVDELPVPLPHSRQKARVLLEGRGGEGVSPRLVSLPAVRVEGSEEEDEEGEEGEGESSEEEEESHQAVKEQDKRGEENADKKGDRNTKGTTMEVEKKPLDQIIRLNDWNLPRVPPLSTDSLNRTTSNTIVNEDAEELVRGRADQKKEKGKIGGAVVVKPDQTVPSPPPKVRGAGGEEEEEDEDAAPATARSQSDSASQASDAEGGADVGGGRSSPSSSASSSEDADEDEHGEGGVRASVQAVPRLSGKGKGKGEPAQKEKVGTKQKYLRSPRGGGSLDGQTEENEFAKPWFKTAISKEEKQEA
uniref:Uncharacterized protein n=1 Tax=Chromera velia CCMP2878 TaxID=1169474 RepID=A0A0G4GSV7_9ALVE|eukprot:Cvel_23239.t1-p1 / transcript=Cvel_23239.t1 / gene=Cvel_23239 / organism=Chromera_velia_CCMP2878 / gene_product=hypothetical protein / transcript_product=hypothetical protein / location=Cvel_scaffold2373:17460-23204(+) / protein_length=1634 / sequence_SO=supercontig / SO=protein_coding / is_pseudo=false